MRVGGGRVVRPYRTAVSKGQKNEILNEKFDFFFALKNIKLLK
jgi:hypothetical protein